MAFSMIGKEDILVFFMMIWVGVIIPFDKKNTIYNGSRKTRVFCSMTGLIGITMMIFYEICYHNSVFTNIIQYLFQFVSFVFLICSILCYREFLLRKKQELVFQMVAVLSVILMVLVVVWSILYWSGVLEFDVYLFMAPSMGSIMLSAYANKDDSNLTLEC